MNMATVVVHLPLSAMRGEGKPRCAYKTMERGERIIRGEEGGLTLQMGKRGKKGKSDGLGGPDSLSREIADVRNELGSVRCYKSHITSEEEEDTLSDRRGKRLL